MDKCCRNCHYFINGCCERDNFEVMWSESLDRVAEDFDYSIDAKDDFRLYISDPTDFCCNRWE